MTITEHPLVKALYGVEGRAEIVHGTIVHLPMTGYDPHYAALEVAFSLRLYVRQTGRGNVCGDGLGFIVNLPHRMSFAPDAAYFTGPTSGMRFVDGAPDFAVEVRSENDYGPAAEREMTAKRADYFTAGTLVIWDVDLLGEDVVRVYRHNDPEAPATVCKRGQTAAAEPAVPGWTIPVNDLFRS